MVSDCPSLSPSPACDASGEGDFFFATNGLCFHLCYTDIAMEIETKIRVRYHECDPMQFAHHSVYFVWFEAARSEFCRARGIDYNAMEANGYFLPVVETRCRYRAPARYDDEIVVAVAVQEQTRRTVRMSYRITRDETLLAEGETYQMLIGADGKPRVFPPDIGKLFSSVAGD
jgi:acyl-CoA thioester hydrolase